LALFFPHPILLRLILEFFILLVPQHGIGLHPFKHCSLLIFVFQVTTFLAFLLSATGHWFTGLGLCITLDVALDFALALGTRSNTLQVIIIPVRGGTMETSSSLSDFGGEGRRLVALRPRGALALPLALDPFGILMEADEM
jgi:hypothetical protein